MLFYLDEVLMALNRAEAEVSLVGEAIALEQGVAIFQTDPSEHLEASRAAEEQCARCVCCVAACISSA